MGQLFEDTAPLLSVSLPTPYSPSTLNYWEGKCLIHIGREGTANFSKDSVKREVTGQKVDIEFDTWSEKNRPDAERRKLANGNSRSV